MTHAYTHGGQRRQRQLVAAVRRKKWHKSLAGSRADESRLGSSTWKGHNQISPRHAQGAATLRSCTLSRPFCLCREGGTSSRAIIGLTLGFPVDFTPWKRTECTPLAESHPIRPANNRAATWHDVTRHTTYAEETLLHVVSLARQLSWKSNAPTFLPSQVRFGKKIDLTEIS